MVNVFGDACGAAVIDTTFPQEMLIADGGGGGQGKP